MPGDKSPWDVPVEAHYSFRQPGDGLDDHPFQSLEVEVTDAGGGLYLVLKTQRWALDTADIERLGRLLRQVLKGRPGMRDPAIDGEPSSPDGPEMEEAKA